MRDHDQAVIALIELYVPTQAISNAAVDVEPCIRQEHCLNKILISQLPHRGKHERFSVVERGAKSEGRRVFRPR